MWKPSLNPEIGTTSSTVVLLESLADPALRLTATPDLVPGDMVEWQGEATVFPNGTFAAKGSFYARYVGSDVWVLQTINGVIPEPEPEPEPEPTAATAYAAPVGGSLGADYETVTVVTPEPEPIKQKGPPPGKGWRK